MKKVGIVVDNYKIPRYEKTLKEKGFEIVAQEPFGKTATTLKVLVEDSKVKEVHKLCQLNELHFKRAN